MLLASRRADLGKERLLARRPISCSSYQPASSSLDFPHLTSLPPRPSPPFPPAHRIVSSFHGSSTLSRPSVLPSGRLSCGVVFVAIVHLQLGFPAMVRLHRIGFFLTWFLTLSRVRGGARPSCGHAAVQGAVMDGGRWFA